MERQWVIRMNRTAEIKRVVLCAGVCLTLVCVRQAPAQPVPGTSSAPGGTSRSSVLSDALQYTGQERAILGGISDGDSQFETTGLYILLAHAARLPGMAEEFASHADQPAIDNLWSQPEAYRGRLIRLRGHYAGLTEERQVAANPWFDKRFFLLHMKVLKAREAIVVALTQQPPAFRLAQPLEVTGLMYKTVAWQTREDNGDGGPRRLFPVLVAKTIAQAEVPEPVKDTQGSIYMVVMITTGMLILMLAMRLWRFRPMAPAASMHRQRDIVPAAEDQGEVDPELCRAVKEFQSESRRSASKDCQDITPEEVQERR
jgi:hypothetical protein